MNGGLGLAAGSALRLSLIPRVPSGSFSKISEKDNWEQKK